MLHAVLEHAWDAWSTVLTSTQSDIHSDDIRSCTKFIQGLYSEISTVFMVNRAGVLLDPWIRHDENHFLLRTFGMKQAIVATFKIPYSICTGSVFWIFQVNCNVAKSKFAPAGKSVSICGGVLNLFNIKVRHCNVLRDVIGAWTSFCTNQDWNVVVVIVCSLVVEGNSVAYWSK